MKRYSWLLGVVLFMAGCATGRQDMHGPTLEQDVVQLQITQQQMQTDFDRRMASMELSLLRQEKFLRDYFDVSGTVPESGLLRGPEPGLQDEPAIPDPGVAEPETAEPEVKKPDGAKPGGAKPEVTKPDAPKNDDALEQRAEAAPKPAQAKPMQAKAETPAQAFYDQALQKYYRGEYSQAREDFTSFAQKFPDSPLQDNALYWLAETHYAQKEYAQAVLVFKELTRRYPKSLKTPDALLKAGFAYERLGDIPNARFHLQIVLDDHPGTRAATLARQKMDALNGS